MSVRDKIFEVAEQLAKTKPFDQITFAEIAERADVHWTTVRRHFGNKMKMKEWLKGKQWDDPLLDQSDTKSRIITAAETVFTANGYANSSLEQVAEHAGLTKGAVYWHFSSKQDLFIHVLEKVYDQQIRQLPALMEKILTSEDPMDQLVQWLQSQFLCLEQGEERASLFLQFLVSGQNDEFREKLERLHAKFLDDVGVLLHQMQQKGYLADDIDPRSLAIMLDVLLKGVPIQWMLDRQSDSLQALIQTISRTLWKGIKGND